MGLDEFAEARRDFQRALELAQQGQAQSLVLHALSGVGVLLAREGRTTHAAEILLFSVHHPGMPAAYRMVAQADLEALEAQLPAQDLAGAREGAATTDLEKVAEAVGSELACEG